MSKLKMPNSLPEPNINENAKIVLQRRYQRKDTTGVVYETPKELFWRVASSIAEEERKYGESVYTPSKLAREFYDLMTSYRFLPNSPTLMNAGTGLGQLAACFVLPVEDSIEGIFDAVKHAAMIHKSGGGTGFSFSRLRAKESVVGSTGGVASGPLSFLKIFNCATEQIKQGGTRRGANMGILRVDHPDIMDFIKAKERDGELNNFNLSIGLTEQFMQAVEKKEDYDLIAPNTHEVVGQLNAREVFNILVNKAWESGDPGIVFLDRINRDNPTPAQGEIESTNPCGEQPLLPYEACNLGSINLGACFAKGKNGHDSEIDWEELRRIIHLSVRFLDNVIDASIYPLDKITETVERNRKIGLGVMGWADLLFQLNIPYNSQTAIDLGERVMKFMRDEARAASKQLAAERGPFPAYAESIFGETNLGPYRNATTTTIAPTGTLSIIAGCSSGVEPLFALSFVRNVMDDDKLLESNPFFEKALREADAYSTKLMEEIAKVGTIRKMDHLPESLRSVFVTAMDIQPIWHLKMQAAFQKYTDNAVSKTVNLPNEATREEIWDIYWKAYEYGCKGVTVYRDGSKMSQVLCTGDDKEKKDKEESGALSVVQDRPDVIYGFTQKIATGLGVLFLTVNEVNGKPFEVFATIGKSGGSITAKAEAIGRLVSLALRSGVEVREIVQQLKGIGGENPRFMKKHLVKSIPDAIAHVFESRYMQGDRVDASAASLNKELCPDCGEALVFEEGCHICKSCAYTKCG
ncbi:Vitamin B12-dependent ribonucleoside-diphosphate reductase [Pseudodesulfovibrio profundus]|uniref:Vitamin B12-dependent ribonucleotide reductase n=1 Tax=Pseudodesulfovibrio profundus TaxID=57320 RepID=A0A2C8F796_9BACT|nr:vitamin B12-dependent ribonucleotide reductase [Pseudodesulfovibrio profundus]MBC17845.1 ribonucleoside-diphosphate reductase, adenosylcobalamin-dependent [Desulfovibrio sp.]SOB58451.1 Vitamin B12-dependent ribonucleoside-diphosphate reductase [Pseudodesulfovibrio profundus]|tara:strand:+ start:28357 stop:30606 length:2250 start_codon:yes stop_codon:yes gene_type:complete